MSSRPGLAAVAAALAVAAAPAGAAGRIADAAAPAGAAGRIADDYARALSEARRLDVPILVDVWAPW